jgi:hypothetical protein
MKPLIAYKSLLRCGGLLLIALAIFHLTKPNHDLPAKAAIAEKQATECQAYAGPDDESYIKHLAEQLFPVLKSLNLM